MPLVEEIFSGTVLYTSGSGIDPADIVVGLLTVAPLGRSVLYVTNDSNTNLARIQSNTWLADLKESGSDLVIDFSRRSLSGAQNMTLSWVVVVYAAAALEQDIIRGTVNLNAQVNTFAIDGVDTVDENATMIILSGKANITFHNDTSASWTVSLVNGTAAAREDIQFDFTVNPTDGICEANYQIVPFKAAEVYIEHGTSTFTTTGTQAISGFTTLANMFALKLGQLGAQVAFPAWCAQLDINSLTEIQFDQNSGGTPLSTQISWSIMEILDGAIVETGVATMTFGVLTANPSFTALTDGQTSFVHGNPQAYNAYMTNTVPSGQPGAVFISSIVDGDEAGNTLTRRKFSDAISTYWVVIDWTVTGTPAAELEGAAAFSLSHSGGLQIGKSLDGDLAFSLALVGDLGIGKVLAGDLAHSLNHTGNLEIGKELIGALVYSLVHTGQIEIGKELIGDLAYSLNHDGVLTIGTRLLGDLAYSLSHTGDIQIGQTFEGALNHSLNHTGSIALGTQFIGDLVHSLTHSGDVGIGKFFAGALTHSLEHGGILTLGSELEGDLIHSFFHAGDLQAGNLLTGDLAYSLSHVGDLGTGSFLIGALAHSLAHGGALTVAPGVGTSGALLYTLTHSGDLQIGISLEGGQNASLVLTGALTVQSAVVGEVIIRVSETLSIHPLVNETLTV